MFQSFNRLAQAIIPTACPIFHSGVMGIAKPYSSCAAYMQKNDKGSVSKLLGALPGLDSRLVQHNLFLLEHMQNVVAMIAMGKGCAPGLGKREVILRKG